MVRRIALIVILLGAALTIVWSAVVAPRVLPRLRVAPAFVLTSATGQTVTSEQLRGKVLVIAFAPTACTLPCSALAQNVETALGQGAGTIAIQPIWIVTDPVNTDSLAVKASELNQNLGWLVLSQTDSSHLELVLQYFRVPRYNLAGSQVSDPYLVLVDPAGIVRAEYRIAPDPTVLTNDLGALEREIRESRGFRRYLYEAAHLFTCSVGGV